MKVYLQKESFVITLDKLKYKVKINKNKNLKCYQLNKNKFCKTACIYFPKRCYPINITINKKQIHINEVCFYFNDQHLICILYTVSKNSKVSKDFYFENFTSIQNY